MSEENIKQDSEPEAAEILPEKKEIDPFRKKKWTCEGQPLWRIYLNSYIEKEKKLEREDKFGRRRRAKLPRDLESGKEMYPYECYPLNILNLSRRAQLPSLRTTDEKIRIWRNMKADPQVDMASFTPVIPEVKITGNGEWPTRWPCLQYHDQVIEDGEGGYVDLNDVDIDDYVTCKELGHARVPLTSVSFKKTQIVDQSTGERPGLVDGDYITCEFKSEGDDHKRVYTQVCLRGTKGMHLIELTRVRTKTWKFCFYQALVALLVKTQLRYKFATSSNVDYIYEHAWMLFIHVGSLSINRRLRLDDVVVHNYKYSVELELVQELKDFPMITEDVGFRFLEPSAKLRALKRPELMKMTAEIGWKKAKEPSADEPVHECCRDIEKWFDQLSGSCKNCVFRTSRFSVAFWNDGNFWYLYNPYRCDRFGFWDDSGGACIVKFCTRVTLKRHLMILLIRAYAYKGGGVGKISRDEGYDSVEVKSEVGNVENELEIRGGFNNLDEEEKELGVEENNSKEEEENLGDKENNLGDEDKNLEDDEKNLGDEDKNLEDDDKNLGNKDTNLEDEEKKLRDEDKNLEGDDKNLGDENKNLEDDDKNLENKDTNLEDEEKEVGDEDKNLEEEEKTLEDEDNNLEKEEENSEDKEINLKNEESNLENTEIVNDSKDEEKILENVENIEDKEKNSKENTITIQIFELIYHCAKINNLKLLKKKPPKPKTRTITKEIDECDLNLNKLSNELDTDNELIEKSSWLRKYRITWSKFSASTEKKSRWHEYYIEEPRKLFSLWGEIHPTGNIFAEENRGKQIHACYLVCAGMSRIMAPEYWSSKTLDTVVMCGDRYYTCSRLQSDAALGNSIVNDNNNNNNDDRAHELSWDRQLAKHFKIADMLFEVDVLPAIYGRLYTRNSLWKILEQMFLKYSHGVLTCEDSCLGIFKFCGSYYILDANSIGPPIFNYGDGVVYLLRATSFSKFMTALILTVNSLECSQFVVNPIDILKIIDTESLGGVKGNRKFNKNKCKNKKKYKM
ncbi:uncharacterized protein LOC130678061 [Microplitis mediator]|uniref:uncharacterized protein LOC130678061 n=1 Tax=Microplitis mediator TaxID=375433 RepID=UPI0025569998|nr:uncharacterized protein LOC130678061 [Microplitis mediator]